MIKRRYDINGLGSDRMSRYAFNGAQTL